MTQVSVCRNQADADDDGGGFGGGLLNQLLTSTVVMSSSQIVSNTASDGAGIYNLSGALVVARGVISGNVANGSGGGIQNRGTTSLVDTAILSNTATWDGGGIDNEDNGVLSITGAAIHGNLAQGINGGGGIFHLGHSAVLDRSTIAHNRASFGEGGGLWNGAILELSNVTLSGNVSMGRGGGLFTNFGATAALTHTTVAFNQTGLGTGGGLYWKENTTATLHNTIVYSNNIHNCAGLGGANSAGYNLDDDGTCNLTGPGDLTGSDPLLGPLQDNGGPPTGWGQAPRTHALLIGSPAIDTVPQGHCSFATDQRGVPRPQGVACDRGAYEHLALDLSLTKVAHPLALTKGNTLTYTLVVTNRGPITATGVRLTDCLSAEVALVAIVPGSPTCTVSGRNLTCNLGTLRPKGLAGVTIFVTPTIAGTLANTATVIAAEPEVDPVDNTDTVWVTVQLPSFHYYSPLVFKRW